MDTAKLILEYLVPILFAFLTPVVIYFSHRLIKWLESKTQFEIAKDQKDTLDKVLMECIAYAEQIALAKLKATGKVCAGSEKMQDALGYASAAIARNGLPGKTAQEVIAMIESKLGLVKINGGQKPNA